MPTSARSIYRIRRNVMKNGAYYRRADVGIGPYELQHTIVLCFHQLAEQIDLICDHLQRATPEILVRQVNVCHFGSVLCGCDAGGGRWC